jgi:hypothetical protein
MRNAPPPNLNAPRTSKMAISSLIMGVCSFVFWILTGLPAVILGVVALVRINRSNGRLTGNGLAIAGICTGGLATFLILPIMIALLLPAVQAAREAARRNVSMNNLKQMMIAEQNALDTGGAFPATGDKTKSQLSWRVRILPFIEEEALYKKFRLDEPWDSENNRALIGQMPQLFESPGVDLPAGKTCYLAVTGPGTAFDDGTKGPTVRDFTDGLSRTVVVVEADPDQAVEWTKPDDWQFDPTKLRHGLGKLRRSGFLAGFADASIAFIHNDESDKAVHAMMTRAGGERN